MLSRQTKVKGYRKKLVPFLWWQKVKFEECVLSLEEVPDEEDLQRTFEHTCNLIKATVLAGPTDSRFLLYLDELGTWQIEARFVQVQFSSTITEPTAKISITGYGTRFEELKYQRINNLCLIFKDREQMQKYLSELTVAAKVPTAVSVYNQYE